MNIASVKKGIVVTGGAGFVGSALVRGILAEGVSKVIVIDNLLSGREENLSELAAQVDLRKVDIRDYDAVATAVAGTDTVFHLAAIPSVPRSIDEPVPSHDVNINGTFNVFRASQHAGVRRIVYAASSSAYGDSDVLPKVETMTPKPKSPYAVQKLVGEYYSDVFYSCFGIETVALRFFNVYGPRQDPSSPYSGVLSVFMTCILERRSPTMYGDGEQSRDFTFVDDVVQLLLKAATAPSSVCGKVYNAGNGNRYRLNEVWETLQRITGVSLPAKYVPDRAGDVRHSQADTTAAVSDLGHSPKYSLEEGLRQTFEWYRINSVATTV
jgi:nucleoside-diphosphate-sugar epimerase